MHSFFLFSSKGVNRFKGNLLFSKVNKSLTELEAFMSMLGGKHNRFKVSMDSINLGLWELRDCFACPLLIAHTK